MQRVAMLWLVYRLSSSEFLLGQVLGSVLDFAPLRQSLEDRLTRIMLAGITHIRLWRIFITCSQAQFAKLIGVSLRTLQEWEQGRKRPSGPAAALLRLVARDPEVVGALSRLD